jgi:hypothetical protein
MIRSSPFRIVAGGASPGVTLHQIASGEIFQNGGSNADP